MDIQLASALVLLSTGKRFSEVTIHTNLIHLDPYPDSRYVINNSGIFQGGGGFLKLVRCAKEFLQ